MELPEENNYLEEILDRVERGEQVPLHRNGRLVANVVPAAIDAGRRKQAVASLMAIRERIIREKRGLSVSEILDARNTGRK